MGSQKANNFYNFYIWNSFNFYCFSIPNQYTSQVLLSPTFETSQTSRLLDQYGSFASMAGIDLPKGQASKDIAIEVLNSRNFIKFY